MAGKGSNINKQGKKTDPYQKKENQGKTQDTSSTSSSPNRLRKERDDLKNQVAQLKKAGEDRRKNQYTIALNPEGGISKAFDVSDGVHSVKYYEPIISGEEAALLNPLLVPIVDVMNAAIRGDRMKDAVVTTESGEELKEGDRPVLNSSPLTRCKIAYSALLGNEGVREALQTLNVAIAEVYTTLGVNSSRDLRQVIKESSEEAGYAGYSILK